MQIIERNNCEKVEWGQDQWSNKLTLSSWGVSLWERSSQCRLFNPWPQKYLMGLVWLEE